VLDLVDWRALVLVWLTAERLAWLESIWMMSNRLELMDNVILNLAAQQFKIMQKNRKESK
jgi:hypothetical protein